MALTVRSILNPSEAELERATDVVHEAFGRRFFDGCLDGKESHSRALVRAHFTAALVGGDMVIVERPNVGIVGAAVWFGPGQQFLSTEEQRHAGWDELLAKLPPALQSWWDYFLSRYDQLAEQFFSAGAKLGGYHLQLIGVDPNFQKHGIGRALLKYGEDKATGLKVPTFLETVGADSVKMYQHLGYEVSGTGKMKSPADTEFEHSFLIKHTDNSSAVSA